jgi:thioredoxin-dependent peroxiredoxin
MVKEEQAAPDFKLQDDEGHWRSLADYRGLHLVLYFYPKDDTPGCTAEACSFRDELAEFKTRGIAIVGVSADSVESHQKFKSKFHLSFPLLSDPDKKTIKAYGVWKEKSMYGKKFMGIERTTFIIDGEGKIKKIFPKVKVADHVKDILESFSAPRGLSGAAAGRWQ